MPQFVTLKNGTILSLDPTPFASGGEGNLFKIISPTNLQKQIVKIYKPEKRTKERESKIQFLSSNPPSVQTQDGHAFVIWVNQMVYENGSFCGFMMPMAKGEKLELLCHPKLSSTLVGEWVKFDFQNTKALELRLKLCFNIAVALYHIHKLDNYVLVDMKPDNIMVQSNGLISIIDIDSVAVIKNNKMIFPAAVVTPEYTPPEYYRGTRPDKDGLSDTWDRFSLAVIFYRLLCGIHPFSGSCIGKFENCTGLADMVQHGLFPNGVKKSFFKVIPPPHSNFQKLDLSLRQVFKRCFDDGHNNPAIRPSCDDWCRSLSPQQVIQINRPLPSAKASFPSFIKTKSIHYRPNTNIDVPTVKYENLIKQNGVKALLSGIFGKSKKQRLIELIIQKETEIKQKEEKFDFYSKQLKEIIKKYSEGQERILAKEISKIEHLQNRFKAKLEDIDRMAVELHSKEITEHKIASDSRNKGLEEIEGNIKLAYTTILSNKVAEYETQKQSLYKILNNLQTQSQAEINNLVNNPTKLSKHKIATAQIHNFGQSIRNALATAGIFTAADFMDISSDGSLKNRQGSWIKVNGVGWNRAFDLREWQLRLELQENQAITKLITQNYADRIASANININQLDQNFLRLIEPYKIQFNKERLVQEKVKDKINNIYKENISAIKEKYDKLHAALIYKVDEFMSSAITPNLKEIAVETPKDLDINFNFYISEYGSTIREINSFTEEFKTVLSDLKQLHDQLV